MTISPAELNQLRAELAQRSRDLADTHADRERLRTERDRYRTAWGMARTRAISIGGAADRYAARARDAQEALQHMLFTVIASQLARRAAAEEIAELKAERHSANEQLRADRDRIAALESSPLDTEPEPAYSFFRPGRVYTRDLPYRAPEDRPNFECVGVGVHPSKGARRAFGFEQPGDGQPWVSTAQRDEEWADGWIDLGPIRPDRLTRTFAPTQALPEDQEVGE